MFKLLHKCLAHHLAAVSRMPPHIHPHATAFSVARNTRIPGHNRPDRSVLDGIEEFRPTGSRFGEDPDDSEVRLTGGVFDRFLK